MPFISPAQDYDLPAIEKILSAYAAKGNAMQVAEREWLPPAGTQVLRDRAASGPDSSYSQERSAMWAFDSAGHILSIQHREPDEHVRKGLAETQTAFYYNTQGKLIALSTGAGGKREDSVTYHYLKNGRVADYMVFNGKNELQYKITYTYKGGQVSMLRKKDRENMAIAMIRYKYGNGQLMETQHFDRNFRLTETRRYSNKQEGGREQGSFAIMGADGKMKGGASWIKDKEGRIWEENEINGDREVTAHRSYTYDTGTEPVSGKVFDALEESNITYRYTYDAQQNWIRRETYYDDLLRSVTLREIQYRR